MNFVDLRDAGDPVEAALAYNAAGADELCFLDIPRPPTRIAARCTTPPPPPPPPPPPRDPHRRAVLHALTIGGGVRSVEDVEALLHAGATRSASIPAAVADPDVVARAADRFRRAMHRVAIDAKTVEPGRWEIFTHGGRRPTGVDAVEFARTVAAKGAGEILLDIDGPGRHPRGIQPRADSRDFGRGGCSGDRFGRRRHARPPRRRRDEGGASAVLAASIFHFGDYTIREAKEYMARAGIPVRLQ